MKRKDVFNSFDEIRDALSLGYGVVFVKKNGSFVIYGDPKDSRTCYPELTQNYEGARVLHGEAVELYIRN